MQGRLLRFLKVAIWTIFEFLGGLVIYKSYQVKVFTWIKSYICLWVYTQKGFSAGGTVSTIPCTSMAPITAPGGRDLGDV